MRSGVPTSCGDGSFRAPQQLAVGNGPDSIVLADMNHDGKLDVVTANFNDGTVSELLGNGNGTYQGVRNFGVATHPIAVQVGDFNGDGNADIAAGMTGGKAMVLTGKGDGSFNGGKTIDISQALNSIAAADFNASRFFSLARSLFALRLVLAVPLTHRSANAGRRGGVARHQRGQDGTGSTPLKVRLRAARRMRPAGCCA